ncbi:MAG: 50S ribosomal protein L29 [Eubacteriales bacterium]|nr:50S ribosomal protein L29 [Eubacteriales bacterium]
MKSRDFVKELDAKEIGQLQEDLVAAKKELFNLRFQNATNQLENTGRIKEVRRNIARIQTKITEKQAVAER